MDSLEQVRRFYLVYHDMLTFQEKSETTFRIFDTQKSETVFRISDAPPRLATNLHLVGGFTQQGLAVVGRFIRFASCSYSYLIDSFAEVCVRWINRVSRRLAAVNVCQSSV